MFENLSDKLQRSFKTLRGQGTITDENIAEALREIRLALIEADVSLPGGYTGALENFKPSGAHRPITIACRTPPNPALAR